jgi:hypothetical protein
MIKFGMTIAEMITQLTRGFMKATGRKPDGIEKIKIQQEAVNKFKEQQKVVDMKGRTLDPDKVIMGGTQEGNALKSGIMKATDMKPRAVPESFQKQIEQKYGITLQGDETVDEIKKIIEDLPTDKKANGGRIGLKGGADMGTVSTPTRKATAKSVNVSPTGSVTTSKDKGPDPVDDKSTFEQTINQRNLKDKPKDNPLKNIIEAGADFNYLKNLYQLNPQGIATSFLLNRMGNVLFPDTEEEKADGGRIGLKDGMNRRTFMKIMGGLATLPVLGKYFTGAKKAAPIVAEKAVEVAQAAPKYFYDLVAKIKMFGDDITGSAERTTSKKYKNYTLEEDMTSGDITVKKTKEGVVGDMEGTMSEEYMVLKKGQADETTKGRLPPDDYEEITIKPDAEGKMKDIEDGIESVDEIIEEVSKKSPPIKKAAGGLAYMLGE